MVKVEKLRRKTGKKSSFSLSLSSSLSSLFSLLTCPVTRRLHAATVSGSYLAESSVSTLLTRAPFFELREFYFKGLEVFFSFELSFAFCFQNSTSSHFLSTFPSSLPLSSPSLLCHAPVTVLFGAVRAAAASPVSAGGPKAKKPLLPEVWSAAGLSPPPPPPSAETNAVPPLTSSSSSRAADAERLRALVN